MFWLAPGNLQGMCRSWRESGDFITFEIAGESLFCVRTKEGDIKAYYNVCQHRAHQLVKGQGNMRLIVCPYHAWTYELTGQLRAGPNTQSVKVLIDPSICLTEVKLENFCGSCLPISTRPHRVWTSGSPVCEKNCVLLFLKLIHCNRWTGCRYRNTVTGKFRRKLFECYHCQLNHPTFATGIVQPETYDIQAQGHCLRHTTECQNLDQMTYPIDLDANAYAGKYSSWFLWPLFSFQVYPGNVLNTYHWRTLDHDRVDVWRGWYATDESDREWLEKLAQQDRETTVEEDIHLVESVQRGLNSRGYIPGPLVVDPSGGVKSEHSIQVLQQWMREGVELN